MSEHKMTHFAGIPIGFAMIDGGTVGDLTVMGIKAQDELLAVYSVGSASDVLSTADLTSEFSVSADNTINNAGGTNTENAAVIVMWKKVHPNA